MKSSPIDFVRPKQLNGPRILSWFSLKNPQIQGDGQRIKGLNVGFNSHESQEVILQNLHTLCEAANINVKKLALAKQVHGDHVEVIHSSGFYDNTDAFVTRESDVPLVIQVADCGTVLLGDSKNKVIGAAHAGWRGAVKGIAAKTVREMIKLGAEADSIHVFVSACLSEHNFEVGEEVAEQFSEHLVNRINFEKPHVNLQGLIIEQLENEGVPGKNIEVDDRCTIDHSDLFYSYRREKDESGRMAAIIKLNKI